MIVKEITNNQARDVLCHPEIYDVISDDNSESIGLFFVSVFLI